MAKVTVKEEKLLQLAREIGNQAEAYRQVYKSKATAKTCVEEASRIMNKPNVAARVKELQAITQEKHNITVESLLNELEEARTVALTCETPQSSAAVTATMGKAKLCGLDKQIIETTIKIQDDGSNSW